MIILTLFGTTTGLELLNIPLTNNIPPLKLEDAWIGVNSSQLSLQPDKDVYLVFRRSVNGHLVTWIGIYRPIREMGYDRAGSFYGAGAWIIDGAVDAKILIAFLRQMLDQVNTVAIQGDRFIKKLADVKGQFTPPNQVSTLISSISKINTGIKPEGESGFIIEGANPIDVIEWAQRASSASYFSKLVIGSAEHTPGAGQSSAFKIFPSLSMAIDTAYLRHITEARHRNQELTQTIISLEKKKNENEFELQTTLKKLNSTEVSRQQFREAAINYENLYRESISKQSTASINSSPYNNYGLVNDQDVILGYGGFDKTSSDLNKTNPQSSNYNFNNTTANPNKYPQPSKTSIYKDDRMTIGTFITIAICTIGIAIILVWGFVSPKKDCFFYTLNCKSVEKPIISNFENSSSANQSTPIASETDLQINNKNDGKN